MDILQARKRAAEEQKKQASGDTRPAQTPSVEAGLKLASADQAREEAPMEQKPKKIKEPALKKTKSKKPKAEVTAESPIPKSPEPVKHTRITEIPQGAKAPEELELAPHEFHGLPGTQDMPELPELMEEELTGSVELGDAPSTQPEPVPEEEPVEFAPSPTVEKSVSISKGVQSNTPGVQPSPPVADEEKIEDEESVLDDDIGRPEKLSAEETPLEFLSFMLGAEEYGIPLQRISEIIKPRSITEVPRVPPFVMGILTLRGVVIPVFDLTKRLSLGQIEIGKFSRIIIVYQKEEKIGLLVDRVRDVVRVLPRDIEPPPPVIAGVDMQFLEGVGRAEGVGIRAAKGVEKSEGDARQKDDSKVRRRLLILLNLERVATL